MTYLFFSTAMLVVAMPMIYRYTKARKALPLLSPTLARLYIRLSTAMPVGRVAMVSSTVQVICPDMFNAYSYHIEADAEKYLQALAAVLKSFENVNFFVNGYTCNESSDLVDIDLSGKRAESIRSLLIAAGITGEKILASGMGEAQGENTSAISTINAEIICYEIRK